MTRLYGLLGALALALLPIPSKAYVIEIYDTAAASLESLAEADLLIAGGTPDASAFRPLIDLDDLGDATRGHFSLDQPIPGGVIDTFAVRVSGVFWISAPGEWTFGINHDDGARLTIDGTVVAADGVADNRDSFLQLMLGVGLHAVEIVAFENLGGTSLEFFGAQGAHTAFNSSFALIQSVPEPGVVALMSIALLGVGFRVRRGRSR